jgi:transposase-like protein
MARKRHTSEEIVAKLRQVDVRTSQGRPVAEAVRAIGVTEVTCYRWRSEHGGLKGDRVKRLRQLEAENTRLRRAVSDLTLDKMILAEAARGNFRAPPAAAPGWSTLLLNLACPRGGPAGFSGLGSGAPKRSRQRKLPSKPEDEAALTAGIVAPATRYGYRRITALLQAAGWVVNRKRVERLWRREGLKVPARQPKRGRLWLNDGSCIRLRPEHPNHVWSYAFVEDRTHGPRQAGHPSAQRPRSADRGGTDASTACST